MQVLPRVLLLLLIAASGLVSANELLNINTATAAELAAQLKGIGPSKASAIVKYRADHGPFRTVDELLGVKGIGQKTLEKLRQYIRVSALNDKASRLQLQKRQEQEQQTRLKISRIIQMVRQ